jgi:hypothetical protein
MKGERERDAIEDKIQVGSKFSIAHAERESEKKKSFRGRCETKGKRRHLLSLSLGISID